MAEGKKTEGAKSGGIFDGLSVSQVVAAALAAVTSLFLSSQIGIAGSLIGAAVSSVVATVSSQVYKQFISASAEKIKDIRPDDKGGIDDLERMSREAAERAQAGGVRSEETRRMDAATGAGALETRRLDLAQDSSDALSSQQTTVMAMSREGFEGAHASDLSAAETRVIDPASLEGRTVASPTPRVGNADENVSPTIIKARAERARKKRAQTAAVAVAAVTALIAVLVSAAFINFVTAGEGVGTKPQSIVPAVVNDSAGSASDQKAEPAPSAKEDSAKGDSAQKSESAAAPTEQGQQPAQEEGSSNEGSTGGSVSSGSDSGGSGSASAGSGGSSSTSGEGASGGSSSGSDGSATTGGDSSSSSGSGSSQQGSSGSDGTSSVQGGSSSSGSSASGLSTDASSTSQGK